MYVIVCCSAAKLKYINQLCILLSMFGPFQLSSE